MAGFHRQLRESYVFNSQTSQIIEGERWGPLVSTVMQGQQCPGNCSRNSMQGHKYISNAIRNTELAKRYSKAGTSGEKEIGAGCFGRRLKQERVNQRSGKEHQKVEKEKGKK